MPFLSTVVKAKMFSFWMIILDRLVLPSSLLTSILPFPQCQCAEHSPSQVIALYDYDSQGDQELDLEEGDIITVIAKEDDVWWCGQCKGRMGMFPSNYVEAYDEGM